MNQYFNAIIGMSAFKKKIGKISKRRNKENGSQILHLPPVKITINAPSSTRLKMRSLRAVAVIDVVLVEIIVSIAIKNVFLETLQRPYKRGLSDAYSVH